MPEERLRLKLAKPEILKRPLIIAATIIALAGTFFTMLSFRHGDSQYNIAWSVELLDCIFRKTELGFYEYSKINTRAAPWLVGAVNCDKTVLVMLPLAIWNIPVWIAHEISGDMIVTGIWDIAWMKFGSLICTFITAAECSRIIRIVKPDADHLLVYPLIIGSYDVICSTMYYGQDEMIYIMLLMFAMRFMLEGKMKKFLIFATLSVTLNTELLIPFLLMVMFFEKRIQFVALNVLITYAPSLIINLIYSNNELYRSNNWVDMTGDQMTDLFNGDIGFAREGGNVSLFLVIICILVFFVFTRKKEDTSKADMIWDMALVMTVMTLFSSGDLLNANYRIFFYVPFLSMLVLTSELNAKTSLLLYTFFTFARSWLGVIMSDRVFFTIYYYPESIYKDKIYEYYGSKSLGLYIGDKIPILGNESVIATACVALAAVLFFINHKTKRDRSYKTFNIPNGVYALAVTLFTPLLCAGFMYMMKDTSVCHKRIVFGSQLVQEATENEEIFKHENYMHFSKDLDIIYENGVCLTNGEDAEGLRYIYQNGGSFGPYITLYPGTYEITLTGYNLDNAVSDCIHNENMDLIPLPSSEPVFTEGGQEEDSPDTVTYTVHLDDKTSNIEIRVFNYDEVPVILESVDIEEIR